MRYGYDLNERQARRIAHQAAGESATVWLEPHGWPEPEPIITRFEDSQDDVWVLGLEPSPELTAARLVGRCVEGTFTVAGHRYQFSTYVLDVRPTRHPNRLTLARPENLQVTQRRRFNRVTLMKSSAVRLWWSDGNTHTAAVGDLLNIGPEGLAVSLPAQSVETLLVGNPARLEFRLQDAADCFTLDGEIVTKTAASNLDHVVVGLCFVEDQRPQAQRSLARLRIYLSRLLTGQMLPSGGE